MNASILLTKDVPSSVLLLPSSPASQLPAHRLHGGCSAAAVVPLRVVSEVAYLRVSDPALRAMTDFDRVTAFTVSEDAAIDRALDDMFRFGVRALLTIRDGKVTGLLTSYDIQGNRPDELVARATDLRREDIPVRDVRTPWSELPLITFEALQSARVSDILELFDLTEATHLMVIESSEASVRVRGVLSRTRLERQVWRSI